MPVLAFPCQRPGKLGKSFFYQGYQYLLPAVGSIVYSYMNQVLYSKTESLSVSIVPPNRLLLFPMPCIYLASTYSLCIFISITFICHVLSLHSCLHKATHLHACRQGCLWTHWALGEGLKPLQQPPNRETEKHLY